MSINIRRILMGSCLTITLSGLLVASSRCPRTSTQRVKTGSTTKTDQLSGTVVAVDGSTLVVKMASGDLRTFESSRIQEVRRRRQRTIASGTQARH